MGSIPNESMRLAYGRLLRFAQEPRAVIILAVVAFAEACILPLPSDVLLVPMMLARPKSVWHYAALASVASILGAASGYTIGYMTYKIITNNIVTMYGLGHFVDGFHSTFSHWGVLIILAKGVTPVPFKWLTIASGLERFSLARFMIACAIARSAHYFFLAAVLKWDGGRTVLLLDRHLERVAMILLVISGSTAIWFF